MRKTRDGRRFFSRAYKVAAVRRVIEGEPARKVAEDLDIGVELLWRWRKRVAEKGEEHLYGIGERSRQGVRATVEGSQQRRMAELERLVGRQELEIRFLEKALRRVEERRQQKSDDGEAASSKR
jgi:transposase-like protein